MYIAKIFRFTSSANRCFPFTTTFPSFGVEIVVTLLIVVGAVLFESDTVEIFDLFAAVRWSSLDFDEVEYNFT